MPWRANPRRRVTRPPLVYWPLAGPFLLVAAVLAVFMVTFLLVGVLTYALARLGIGPTAAALVLAACLLDSAVNIPVVRFRGSAVQMEHYVSVFGICYLVPVQSGGGLLFCDDIGSCPVSCVPAG